MGVRDGVRAGGVLAEVALFEGELSDRVDHAVSTVVERVPPRHRFCPQVIHDSFGLVKVDDSVSRLAGFLEQRTRLQDQKVESADLHWPVENVIIRGVDKHLLVNVGRKSPQHAIFRGYRAHSVVSEHNEYRSMLVLVGFLPQYSYVGVLVVKDLEKICTKVVGVLGEARISFCDRHAAAIDVK